jgi:serine/threonine protein kinase/DNA-binding beta-propeller fold protein YncE
MPANAATHPTADTLRALGMGTLDQASAAALLSHLEQCPDCRREAVSMCGAGILEKLRAGGHSGATASDARDPANTAGEVPPAVKAPQQASSLPPTTEYQDPTIPPELRDHAQYEVQRELGRGGMGVVFLARNKLMDRLEVLKVVNRQLLDHPGAVERFLREIRAAAKLSHPNIVTAHSALQIGELLVFAMEYVEGETLAQFVHTHGRLPVANACYYAQQVALGLQHAFEKGLAHRDIKPQNLILAREGKKHVVKILDFGLAKWRSAGESQPTELTGAGAMMGTPDYMAPEQTLDAASADIRADIYSLGCTLYFLLAGRPPFQAHSQFELLQAHQSKAPTPLNQVRQDVPVPLAAVVARMMAKEPGKRYQKPTDVAQALTPFVKAGPPTPALAPCQLVSPAPIPAARQSPAPPPTDKTVIEAVALDVRPIAPHLAPRRGPRAERRDPPGPVVWPYLVGGGVLLLLIIGAVGLWASGVWRTNKPGGDDTTLPPVVEPDPAYDRTGGRRFVDYGTGNPRLVLWSNDNLQKKFYVRVYDLNTGAAITPSMQHEALIHAWFSPDGKRLVTMSGSAARIWDATTGQPIGAVMQHTQYVYRARFSPDGTRIATASHDQTARVWDAATGEPITPPLKHDGYVRCAMFSPDGTKLVTASGDNDNAARIWDAVTGAELVAPIKHGGVVWHASFSPDGKRVATACRDNTARVWDATTGQPITPPLKHDLWVCRVLFSPHSKRVVTAALDKTARVWDADTGQPITPPLPHANYVWDAQFSPDGKKVVTASQDQTARVWDAATGEAITPPLNHDLPVWQAMFSPDGKQVITAGQVKGDLWTSETARAWDATTGQELKKVMISQDLAAPGGAKDAKKDR